MLAVLHHSIYTACPRSFPATCCPCVSCIQVDVKVTWEEGDVDRFVCDIVRDRKVRRQMVIATQASMLTLPCTAPHSTCVRHVNAPTRRGRIVRRMSDRAIAAPCFTQYMHVLASCAVTYYPHVCYTPAHSPHHHRDLSHSPTLFQPPPPHHML